MKRDPEYTMPIQPTGGAGTEQRADGAWSAFCIDLAATWPHKIYCGHSHVAKKGAEKCLMDWNDWGYKRRHADKAG